MVESDDTGSNEQKAVAKGRGSLAINAAQYASVTVYQYVTYAGDRVTVRETIDPSRCPYPGLETFRTSEAKYFAGRADDVAELESKLRDHNICGVIAASGAGKSSLVHAGLIPALAECEMEAWDIFAFKPGQEPLYGFARSMSGVLAEAKTRKGQFDEIDAIVADLRETPGRLRRYIEDIISRRADAADGKHHRVLIFVDQWEELYTRENDEDREILVRELMDVAERGLAKVLLTMRIDFMDDLVSKSTEFYDALEPAVRILRPLSETGRREAIEKPAEVAGLGVPPELTSRLVADLGKDEGTLPYLQFVLRHLWEKRDKETNSLTTATYDSMDGLKGAIGAHADDVFRKLSKEEQGLAQRVLPRLANVSDTGITSRRLPFADFDEPARKLLQRLAEPDARLIVLSSATEDVSEAEIVAEVAHEALLDDWQTLYGWIVDRKDFFRLRNKLESDAKTWVENDKRNEFLISRKKTIKSATSLLKETIGGEISSVLSTYIRKSATVHKRRKLLGYVSATCLAIIAVIVSISQIQFYNENKSRAERSLITLDQQVGQYIEDGEPWTAAQVTYYSYLQNIAQVADDRFTPHWFSSLSQNRVLFPKESSPVFAGDEIILAARKTQTGFTVFYAHGDFPRSSKQVGIANLNLDGRNFEIEFISNTEIASTPVQAQFLDGNHFAMKLRDGKICISDFNFGDEINCHPDTASGVDDIIFSPDGKSALGIDEQGMINVWSFADHEHFKLGPQLFEFYEDEELGPHRALYPASYVAFSDELDKIWVGYIDCHIQLFDISSMSTIASSSEETRSLRPGEIVNVSVQRADNISFDYMVFGEYGGAPISGSTGFLDFQNDCVFSLTKDGLTLDTVHLSDAGATEFTKNGDEISASQLYFRFAPYSTKSFEKVNHEHLFIHGGNSDRITKIRASQNHDEESFYLTQQYEVPNAFQKTAIRESNVVVGLLNDGRITLFNLNKQGSITISGSDRIRKMSFPWSQAPTTISLSEEHGVLLVGRTLIYVGDILDEFALTELFDGPSAVINPTGDAPPKFEISLERSNVNDEGYYDLREWISFQTEQGEVLTTYEINLDQGSSYDESYIYRLAEDADTAIVIAGNRNFLSVGEAGNGDQLIIRYDAKTMSASQIISAEAIGEKSLDLNGSSLDSNGFLVTQFGVFADTTGQFVHLDQCCLQFDNFYVGLRRNALTFVDRLTGQTTIRHLPTSAIRLSLAEWNSYLLPRDFSPDFQFSTELIDELVASKFQPIVIEEPVVIIDQ